MWKYVTRRIRDSVERTCNVLESRRTWTCGGADKNNGPPANAADDQQGGDACCPSSPHHHHHRFGCRGAVWPPPAASNVVAPIRRTRYDQRGGGDDFRRHHQRCHSHQQGVLGALTWSGAIVAGWYTSQLFGMRRRRRQQLLYAESHRQRLRNIGGASDYSNVPPAVASAARCPVTAALCEGVLSHWMRPTAASEQQQQQQAGGKSSKLAEYDDEWLERVLQAANIRPVDETTHGDEVLEQHMYRVQAELVGFGAQEVNNGRDEVDCNVLPSASLTPQPAAQATSLEPPTKLQPDGASSPSTPTFAGAVQDLLKVIGDIEFQLGVQHMQDERFAVAATHFKLGTSHHHAGATFNLGLCYELGLGVERSASKALECFVLAADQGHPKALYNVGVYHGQGRGGLVKNRRAAREFFAAAARAGQADAQRMLGGKVRPEKSNAVGSDDAGDDWKRATMGEYVPQSDIFRAVAVA